MTRDYGVISTTESEFNVGAMQTCIVYQSRCFPFVAKERRLLIDCSTLLLSDFLQNPSMIVADEFLRVTVSSDSAVVCAGNRDKLPLT